MKNKAQNKKYDPDRTIQSGIEKSYVGKFETPNIDLHDR